MNYKNLFWLLFLLIFPVGIKAQDPVLLISFQQLLAVPEPVQQAALHGQLPEQLRDVHGKDVRVRGFLYEANNGQHVLSAEPDLKSCCVGSGAKLGRQIAVVGLGDKVGGVNGSAVMLQGKFLLSPGKDAGGVWNRLYVLENAVLVESSSGSLAVFIISVLVLILAAACVCYFLCKKR